MLRPKRILSRPEDLAEKISEGVATPYITHSGILSNPCELGYCIVDDHGMVKTLLVVTKAINQIAFKFNQEDIHANDINVNITSDGYVRFWTDNVKYYLKWHIKDDVAYLVSIGK